MKALALMHVTDYGSNSLGRGSLLLMVTAVYDKASMLTRVASAVEVDGGIGSYVFPHTHHRSCYQNVLPGPGKCVVRIDMDHSVLVQ